MESDICLIMPRSESVLSTPLTSVLTLTLIEIFRLARAKSATYALWVVSPYYPGTFWLGKGDGPPAPRPFFFTPRPFDDLILTMCWQLRGN
jgi:hypothetical protein